MKKILFTVAMLTGSSALIAAECTEEQKAQMILSNISQSVINSTCAQTNINTHNAAPMTTSSANATTPVSIGLGYYSMVNTANSRTDTYIATSLMMGAAVIAEIGITDLVSIAGHFYSIKGDFTDSQLHDSNRPTPTLSTTGYDVMARLGNSSEGFTYFVGLGYFSDTEKYMRPGYTSSNFTYKPVNLSIQQA